MNVIEILHHFVARLSTGSMVCLVLSGIAYLALLVLFIRYDSKIEMSRLCDCLIACILLFGVMMMYLAIWPIIVILLVLTVYVISLLMVLVTPSVSSGKR